MTLNTLFGANATAPKKLQFKQIKAVYETINVSESASSYFTKGTRYTAPIQVYEMFRFLMHETKEMFICLHLSGKNSIICVDLVSVGSLNQSIVDPRAVFQTALLSNAAALILVHQHPSGSSNPSPEDISITRRLKEAGDLLNVRVLDHIIVGDGEYLSFVERGLI